MKQIKCDTAKCPEVNFITVTDSEDKLLESGWPWAVGFHSGRRTYFCRKCAKGLMEFEDTVPDAPIVLHRD